MRERERPDLDPERYPKMEIFVNILIPCISINTSKENRYIVVGVLVA